MLWKKSIEFDKTHKFKNWLKANYEENQKYYTHLNDNYFSKKYKESRDFMETPIEDKHLVFDIHGLKDNQIQKIINENDGEEYYFDEINGKEKLLIVKKN